MRLFRDATGFIFDCDGTLLDTLGAWDEAERDLFAQTGQLTQEQEDEIHSAPIERAAEIFHERYGVGDSAEAVLAHLDGHLLGHYRDVANAMPGAVLESPALPRGRPCACWHPGLFRRAGHHRRDRLLEAGVGNLRARGGHLGIAEGDDVVR